LAERGSQLAAAIQDYGAERGAAQALTRLEQRLSAALATPSAAPSTSAEPTWLLSLSVASGVLALALILQQALPDEQVEPVRATHHVFSAAEIASRLGVGPRELASQAAMDTLQLSLFTHRAR
jgi:hypothetical protein